jgi:2-hydroxy-3-oxopropionate reductase
MTRQVGVIGLGTIGKPIAEHILSAGYAVNVYDVRPAPIAELAEAGACACASPAEVACSSGLVISLVLDSAQTEDVVFGPKGIMDSLRPGSLFAVGSTLGPHAVQRVAHALKARGCDTIDMPISGGYVAARSGQLSLMIGADAAALERALPVFRTFASVIQRAGDIGAGQAAKLAHQLILTCNIMALLEGLALGAAAGVDPAILRQIIKEGLAGSTALQVWDDLGPRWKKMLQAMPPGQTPPNLRKDMHAVLTLAQQLGVPLFLATQAALIADSGFATGHDNPAL